jgi:hypothetical protein
LYLFSGMLTLDGDSSTELTSFWIVNLMQLPWKLHCLISLGSACPTNNKTHPCLMLVFTKTFTLEFFFASWTIKKAPCHLQIKVTVSYFVFGQDCNITSFFRHFPTFLTIRLTSLWFSVTNKQRVVAPQPARECGVSASWLKWY